MTYPLGTSVPDSKKRGRPSAKSGKFAALCSLSTLALFLGANSVHAQPAPATTATAPTTGRSSATADESVVLDEFVVSGVRASLISAQEIKQNSPQFVDSIVAEDIGKFPDNTVAEALQRVPGIQVGRSQGEVNSVVVRGLPNVQTTLNGHEIFTGTGRGVALQDLPADLIAGLDVYKSNFPDQTEGGIAGLIDVRLRRPLDFKGSKVSLGVRGMYNDNSGKNGYAGDVLVSNRWKLDGGGEFGALFAASYQRSRVQDTIFFNYLYEPQDTNISGHTKIDLPFTDGAQVNPADRKRDAYDMSFQWKPNSNLELYSDTLYTGYRNTHDVHFFIGFPRFGTITAATFLPNSNSPSSVTSTNNFQLTSTQAFKDKTDSYQTAFGAKWSVDEVRLSTEYVYNWSSFKNRGVIVDTQFTSPATFQFGFDPSNVTITGADVTSANNFALWGLFDNHGYATSHQHEWKGDLDYAIKQGFLSSVKVGVRYTDRAARSRQTAQNDIPPAAGRGVTRTASIPGFGSDTPDANGSFGSFNWYGGDPDFLRDHVATIRTLFGQPTTDPNFFPGNSFTDTEKTYAAYGQVGYQANLGGMPLNGIAGVRLVKTKENVQGNNPDNTPLNATKDETAVLPTLTGVLKLQENLQLRGQVGRSITRPNFNDLNPVTSLFGATTTGGTFGTGSGGNPNLGNVKSNNYDLALEYYFTKASYVSLTGFYRTIDGYVQSFASNETIAGQPYVVTRPRNGGKGHLDGIEASYQQFFDFLPEPLKGFGVATNFTYIEGNQNVANPDPAAPVGSRITQPYTQVSKYNYNVVGIYEKASFSTRLAYNWRGNFVDTFNGPNAVGNPLRTISVKARGQLDFSASYALRKGLDITFDVTNLLNNKYRDYFGDVGSLYPRDYRIYDRTYMLGARYSY